MTTLARIVAVSCALLMCCRRLPDETADPMDSSPRFSPDGMRVAFERDYDTSMPYGVYLIDADGSDEKHLARALCPAWSPDGRRLMVRLENDLSIWEIDAVTGEPLRLVHEVGYIFGGLDWSPDGKWVTYNSSVYPNVGIGRVNVETGEFRIVVAAGSYNARWSANSAMMVYEGGHSGSPPPPLQTGVYIADSAGNRARAVLLDSGGFTFWYPEWYGDSVICAYYFCRDGSYHTAGLAITDTLGNWRPFSLAGGNADFNATTRRFVYSADVGREPPEGATRLFVVNADGTCRRQLTFGNK
jgi:Tol biopolymer transport system component